MRSSRNSFQTRCRAYILPVIKNVPIDFLRMRNKCKIINVHEQTQYLWHTYHVLLVRMYINSQQSYLSQIDTRQTSVEAYFDSNSKSRDCTP